MLKYLNLYFFNLFPLSFKLLDSVWHELYTRPVAENVLLLQVLANDKASRDNTRKQQPCQSFSYIYWWT
jgi:hypothetical protein